MEAASKSVFMQKTIGLRQTEIDGYGLTLVELLVAITVLSALIDRGTLVRELHRQAKCRQGC